MGGGVWGRGAGVDFLLLLLSLIFFPLITTAADDILIIILSDFREKRTTFHVKCESWGL